MKCMHWWSLPLTGPMLGLILKSDPPHIERICSFFYSMSNRMVKLGTGEMGNDIKSLF